MLHILYPYYIEKILTFPQKEVGITVMRDPHFSFIHNPVSVG